jgi:hypothetical protein
MLRNLNFAILAPIPEAYLLDSRETLVAQLDAELEDPSIVLGTNEFEVLGEAQQRRDGDKAIMVFIYASEPAQSSLNPEITWQAIYKGSSHSRRGRYTGNALRRPVISVTPKDTWAVYWELQDLEPMKKPLSMDRFSPLGKKKPCGVRFLPKGPMLVEYPASR